MERSLYFYASYVVNILALVIFVLTRHQIMTSLKLRFLAGRGRCFVRIVGADHHENEAFVNFRSDYIQIGDRIFVKSQEKQSLKVGNRMFESPKKLIPFVVDEKKAAELTKLKVARTGFLGLFKKPILDVQGLMPVDGEGYTLDERKATYQRQFPVFTYIYDNPEPFDFFEKERQFSLQGPVELTCAKCATVNQSSVQLTGNALLPKPVDNAYFSSIIKKALALGRLKDTATQNKRLMMFLMVAAIAAVAAAYFAFQNNSVLQDFVRRGVQLTG